MHTVERQYFRLPLQTESGGNTSGRGNTPDTCVTFRGLDGSLPAGESFQRDLFHNLP